jgi:hypothetical protein
VDVVIAAIGLGALVLATRAVFGALGASVARTGARSGAVVFACAQVTAHAVVLATVYAVCAFLAADPMTGPIAWGLCAVYLVAIVRNASRSISELSEARIRR